MRIHYPRNRRVVQFQCYSRRTPSASRTHQACFSTCEARQSKELTLPSSTSRSMMGAVLGHPPFYMVGCRMRRCARAATGCARRSRTRASIFRRQGPPSTFSPTMDTIKLGAAYRRSSRSATDDANAQTTEGFRKGLLHARYRVLAKAHPQHVITAVAINMVRIAAWAHGTPIAKTRCSHFAALQIQAA
jgi:hypothetical protein